MTKTCLRFFLPACIAGIIAASAPPSFGFLDLFEKDRETAPDNAELQRQEELAHALVMEAQGLEKEGRNDKALGVYKKVVENFPLTTNAALSQYKTGVIFRDLGKFTKAFDGFQRFVEGYKGSAAFNSAIQSQYEITRMGQDGTFKDSFLGIPVKLQKSELVEMYGKVIRNAPQSKYAPLSQFAIGEVYENEKEWDSARAAYKLVVKNYVRSEQAPEAQLRVARLGEMDLERGSQDAGNLVQTREALEDVKNLYPQSSQARAATEGLLKLSSREAKSNFDVAAFYEKQGRYRAARIYYSRVAAGTEGEYAMKAQEKIDTLPLDGPADIETEQRRSASRNSEEKSGGFSMPNLAFWKKDKDEVDEDAGPSPEYYPEGADVMVDESEWAEFERQMADDGEGGQFMEDEYLEEEEKGGFFRSPNFNLRPWKSRDADGGSEAMDIADQGGEEIEAVEEGPKKSRSLIPWKRGNDVAPDEAVMPEPPQASNEIAEATAMPEEETKKFGSRLGFWKGGSSAAPAEIEVAPQDDSLNPAPQVAQTPPPVEAEKSESRKGFWRGRAKEDDAVVVGGLPSSELRAQPQPQPQPQPQSQSRPAPAPAPVVAGVPPTSEPSDSDGRRFRLNPFGKRKKEAEVAPPVVSEAPSVRPIAQTSAQEVSLKPVPAMNPVEVSGRPNGEIVAAPENPKKSKWGIFGRKKSDDGDFEELPPAVVRQNQAQPSSRSSMAKPEPAKIASTGSVSQKKRSNYAGPPAPSKKTAADKPMRALAPIVPVGGNTSEPAPTRVVPPSAEDLPLPPVPEG